jgi:hypothetical protein
LGQQTRTQAASADGAAEVASAPTTDARANASRTSFLRMVFSLLPEKILAD